MLTSLLFFTIISANESAFSYFPGDDGNVGTIAGDVWEAHFKHAGVIFDWVYDTKASDGFFRAVGEDGGTFLVEDANNEIPEGFDGPHLVNFANDGGAAIAASYLATNFANILVDADGGFDGYDNADWRGLFSLDLRGVTEDSFAVHTIAYHTVAVPEPTSLALLGLGLLGFVRRNQLV